ncbi:phosphoenolpyruvate--protein phosphotransferase [Corynebacterium lactis]|uniref:Phosphoenolpyruvate-protein phosphotransferase n=1 Tax=Corynebacterium lactis RW2-5 TaxID=1408189 RepID=A0A0K2H1W2_9CORY|nr:phosphoenolpyruvate--protein phosphotransferase [Corynebacterium lactis]ALA67701.1 phosphoenolpyruvate-protein phosphotransferase [Corynebacterium lactis RW2-5]
MFEEHTVVFGIGVSTGTASAEVVKVLPAPGVNEAEPASTDAAADGQRVREAMAAVASALKDQAEHSNAKARPILEATAQLASDRALAKAVDKKLKKGSGVTRAVHDAVEDYAQLLASLGGYMAERVTDLYDVRDRTICELRGLPKPGVPFVSSPSILLADDLAPAETVGLDPELVVGIVTAGGGPTSHTAILAAQLGIPAVVKASGIMDVEAGTTVAIDGGAGEVIVHPTEEEIAELHERAKRRAAALAESTGAGKTADGFPVKLLANIGTAEDGEAAAKKDVEGTGLFRTEFLFLDRESAPTLEEQTETYTRVLEAFGTRRVVVRTLDAGADKPLSFADLGEEENPALGRRGLRLAQAREDLMDTQLDALAAAFEATGRKADLRVMAPMVATTEEATWFADKARERGLPSVGIMIEVPAAAIRAKQLLSIVDFASIGTNDLSQYTMAADRMQGALSDLLSPWQPAVLQMIRSACKGGDATGKPISVCGEAGGDPLLALVLVGLGVGSLSMATKKVPAVRAALRMHDRTTCQQMAAYAVDAATAEDARAAVENLANPKIKDLL